MSTNFENEFDKYILKRSEEVVYPFPECTYHTLFAGSTLSGKSHAMKEWLDGPFNRIFDDIFVISYTADKENYDKLFEIPEDNILTSLDEDSLDALYSDLIQRFMSREGDYLPLLIFDDMVDTIRKIKNFPKFMSTCRHYGITCWIGCQHVRQCSPPIRAQFYSFVVFPYMSEENMEAVGESTLGKKRLRKILEIIRQENAVRDTKYGYLFWTKKHPDQYFYGLGNEIDEIELSKNHEFWKSKKLDPP